MVEGCEERDDGVWVEGCVERDDGVWWSVVRKGMMVCDGGL